MNRLVKTLLIMVVMVCAITWITVDYINKPTQPIKMFQKSESKEVK